MPRTIIITAKWDFRDSVCRLWWDNKTRYKGGNWYPPKPLVTGGRGGAGGGGKYFLNIYPKWSLHTKFQLPSTKIEGLSLNGGNFYPQTPRYGGDEGGGGGGKYFSKQYLNGRLHAKFQLLSTKIEGVNLNGGWFLPPNPRYGGGLGEGVNYIFLKCPK